MKKLLFDTPVTATLPSVGLLWFRLVFGGFMLVGHGWGKLVQFGDLSSTFPDPLGIGSPASWAGAVTSEVLMAALVVIGLGTRLAALPLMFTMAVAGFVIHAGGPFFLPGAGAKEPALLYLAAYAVLLFTGPGRYSVDYLIGRSAGNPSEASAGASGMNDTAPGDRQEGEAR